MKKKITLFLFAIITFGVNSQIVTHGNDDGTDGSLRKEITDAAPGSTIIIQDAADPILLNSEIIIDKDLIIEGSNASNTIINAQSNSRIFNISNANVEFQYLDLINGVEDNGGAVKILNSALYVEDCSFKANTANGTNGSGGALFIDSGSTFEALNTLFENNRANRAGGAIEVVSEEDNTVLLDNVEIHNNNVGIPPSTPAPGNGGGLHVTGSGSVSVFNSNFSDNDAASEGGALWNGSGSMIVDNTSIANNIANGNDADQGGGGIFNSSGDLSINNNSSFNANYANGSLGSGGAVLNLNGSLIVENSTFHLNEASRNGGAISNSSSSQDPFQLTNVQLTNNSVIGEISKGGAIYFNGNGSIEIDGGFLNYNQSETSGGAIWNGSGNLSIDNVSLNANTASGDDPDQGGGGIYNEAGTITIFNMSEFTGNDANGMEGSGGAILNNSGSLSIENTRFENNTSNRAGGAIEQIAQTGNLLTLDTVEFIENSSISNPGSGGALHITGDGDADVLNSNFEGNMSSAQGGALWNGAGSMSINNSTFTLNESMGNDADQGGGAIFNNGGNVTIQVSTFEENFALGNQGSGGAILNFEGALTVIDSEFNLNKASRAGGAIEESSLAGSMLMVTNSDFNANEAVSAPGNGGAIHITGPGDSVITGVNAMNNVAENDGGAFWNGPGEMTIDSTYFELNDAKGVNINNGGGAVFNNGGNLSILNETEFIENSASGSLGSGGAIFSLIGMVEIDTTSFENNSSNRAGGAIEVLDGNLVINNSLFEENKALSTIGEAQAPGNGGAIHISDSADISIFSTEFMSNESKNDGGGIWISENTELQITYSTLDSNISEGLGGGLYIDQGEATLETSTISRNESDLSGGGVYNQSGLLTLTRSTIAENTSGDQGGGIYDNGQLDLNAVTIAFNNAINSGGGIKSMIGCSMKNTIISDNVAANGTDASGTFSSQGFNLVGNDDEGTYQTQTSDMINMSPNLGPLQNYGGKTETVAILPGSVCVNSGDVIDTFNDQRDFPLVNQRDMGAFEFESELSVENSKEVRVSTIFPNPSNGNITIQLASNELKGTQVSIYDLTGKQVFSNKVFNKSNNINLSNLPSGVYLLNVQNKNKTEQHKLIIQ